MTSLNKSLTMIALAVTSLSVQAVEPTYWSNWEHADVKSAWSQGYKGQGTNILVVDDFSNRSLIVGRLTNSIEVKGHGFWVSQEASLVAPEAKISTTGYMNGSAINLEPGKLNIVNASYGLFAPTTIDQKYIITNATEKSIIAAAQNGTAIVVKAAGNDSVAVGQMTKKGTKDFLASALISGQTTIFAGALNKNGTTASKASMASYSNVAGSDVNVQNKFLSVGVVSTTTNLAGTSFAAPIIDGYAAILGSKFVGANAKQITNQLLTTARTDTVANYRPEVYGRGEASLSRALAPVSIK